MRTYFTPSSNPLFFKALFVNALFSLSSGLIAIFFFQKLSQFFAFDYPRAIMFIGMALIAFAGQLFYFIYKKQIPKMEAMIIIGCDIAWVLASLLLFIVNNALLNSPGWIAVDMIAIVVAALAWYQWKGLTQGRTFLHNVA